MIEQMIVEGKTEKEIVSFLVAQCNMSQEEAEFMYDIVVGRSDGDAVEVANPVRLIMVDENSGVNHEKGVVSETTKGPLC